MVGYIMSIHTPEKLKRYMAKTANTNIDNIKTKRPLMGLVLKVAAAIKIPNIARIAKLDFLDEREINILFSMELNTSA